LKDPIELLMQEHRLMETVMGALDGYAAAVELGSDYERDDLARFVTFIREYADTKHHAKEEDILFTTMVANGFPRDAGPVGVLFHEHDTARAHVDELARAAAGDAVWGEDVSAWVARAARAYTELLRRHIDKEDWLFFPMARSSLPAAAMQEVSKRCEGVEQRYAESGDTARLERLGAELAERNAR
jgi:hemerythrin-like domain-containing protein